MIFVASPYSHPDASVRYRRFHDVATFTGKKILEGFPVISPIAMSHPVFERVPETGALFEDWVETNHALIDACGQVWVLMLDGWMDSRGVADEIEYCRQKGYPLTFFEKEEAE